MIYNRNDFRQAAEERLVAGLMPSFDKISEFVDIDELHVLVRISMWLAAQDDGKREAGLSEDALTIFTMNE